MLLLQLGQSQLCPLVHHSAIVGTLDGTRTHTGGILSPLSAADWTTRAFARDFLSLSYKYYIKNSQKSQISSCRNLAYLIGPSYTDGCNSDQPSDDTPNLRGAHVSVSVCCLIYIHWNPPREQKSCV